MLYTLILNDFVYIKIKSLSESVIQTYRAPSFFNKVNLSIVTIVNYGFKFSINSSKYEITNINFFLI